MNQYTVVKNQQVAIEANDPDEALKKVLDGEGKTSGMSYNVQIRPPAPAQRPAMVTGGIGGQAAVK